MNTPQPIIPWELDGPSTARPGAIEVLTPLACSVLFGRSGEAVRRAAREGHIRTRLTVTLTAKKVRLIDFESARDYWGSHELDKHALRRMRRQAVLGLTVHGRTHQVLHPHPVYRLDGSTDRD